MRVLLIEDDADVATALTSALTLQTHRVEAMQDAAQALEVLATDDFDAVVLDLGLPRMDGLEFLARLRGARNKVPVLVLTARDQIADRVNGLDLGADDYLVKPFDMYELSARLRAIARRAGGRASPKIECRGVQLDPASRSVTREGEFVEASPREYAILAVLMSNYGEAVSRERLMVALYGWDIASVDSNTIDVHISHLRRKLGKDFIRTLRGIGYIIDRVSQ